MTIRRLAVGLCLLLLAGQGGIAFAQDEQGDPAAAAVPAIPVVEDALDRGTPRRSVMGYLKAATDLDFEKAAQYLDTRNLPPEVASLPASELARQLNHVLSRSVWLDDYTISDNPDGVRGDGLPGYRDLMVTIKKQDGEEVPILLQKVPRGDGESIWKISNRSVAIIPDLYDEFSYPPGVETIRGWFPDTKAFLGLELFKWFILVAASLLAWPFLYFLGWVLSRIFSSPRNENYPLVRKIFTGPLVALAILFLINRIVVELGAGAYARQIMETRTVATIVIVWVIWSILTLVRKYNQDRLERQGRPGAAKLLRPLTLLVKLVLLIFAFLLWLHNAGINITTVLAGLGVGGLAVALALQKPLEDMMGAITIFSQAPIRVGDLCRYGQHMGVVEDIGLRTTRLRTLTNTVVSVPNSRLAYMELENISYRTKIRYWPTLRLRYDTNPEQITAICREIVEFLRNDPDIETEGIRARFTQFSEDALLLKVHCFVLTTDFAEYLEISERLNLEIMKIVHRSGARFALPGRAIALEQATQPEVDPS